MQGAGVRYQRDTIVPLAYLKSTSRGYHLRDCRHLQSIFNRRSFKENKFRYDINSIVWARLVASCRGIASTATRQQ